RIHQRLTPFGFLGAEVAVDVKRLRIERHVREQHVVHLRNGSSQTVLVDVTNDEIIEVHAPTRVPLRFSHLVLRQGPASRFWSSQMCAPQYVANFETRPPVPRLAQRLMVRMGLW